MLDKLRYAAYRFKYVNAPKLNLKKPVDISLELSSFCTNTCGYCYHSASKDLPFKRGKMSLNLATKIISEAKELGVNSIKMNYRGESSMNPYFYEITNCARLAASGSTFIDRVMNSNFNFDIKREDIFEGLLNLTKVKVSFDSFRKEIFEKQRRGSNYEKTLANIEKFYNYPNRKTELVIQSVRTKLNADEDLKHEIKKRFPSATSSVRDVVEGRVKKDLTDFLHRRRDYSERQSCIQAHARLIVHWDGKVVPCCPSITDDLVIGDLNTQSIKEVWTSKKAILLRKSLLDKSAFKTDPCKNCSSYETFKGYKAPWLS